MHTRLGEITCPSGTLLLLDFGLLDLWSGEDAPLLDPETASPETCARANAARDFRVTGPDAERAALEFGHAPDHLYDRGEDFEAAFEERVHELGLDARLEPLAARVPHRARVDNALRAGFHVVEFHGPWGACVGGVPQDRAFEVWALPSTIIEERWRAVELRLGGETATTEIAGTVAVDRARLGFLDADAASSWEHHVSADGRADFVFWGLHAKEVAERFDAPPLEDGEFGWLDLPVDEIVELGLPIEEHHATGEHRFATDYRPHSDPFRLLEQIRATESQSGTIEVGGAQVCGFMTTWGDGFFDVELDRDANGRLATVRVVLADE